MSMIEDEIMEAEVTQPPVDTYKTDAAWIQALNHAMVQCLKNNVPTEEITALQIEQIHDLSSNIYSLLSSKLTEQYKWQQLQLFAGRMANLPLGTS